jgi:hypothetical protein
MCKLFQEYISLCFNKSFYFMHRICKKELYKFRTVVHVTVRKWTTIITKGDGPFWLFGDHDFCKVFGQVLRVFQHIIWEDSLLLKEYPSHPSLDAVKSFNMAELVSGLKIKAVKEGTPVQICDFCGADIWNRFIQCSVRHLTEPYVVCTGCFAEGRGCKHRAQANMEFHEMFPLETAVADYVDGVRAWNHFAHSVNYPSFVKLSEDWQDRQVYFIHND